MVTKELKKNYGVRERDFRPSMTYQHDKRDCTNDPWIDPVARQHFHPTFVFMKLTFKIIEVTVTTPSGSLFQWSTILFTKPYLLLATSFLHELFECFLMLVVLNVKN